MKPDLNQIHKLLKQHFQIDAYEIDPTTGLVSTNGHVRIRPKDTHLPVSFHHVGGYLW